jgi:hypothetical protein
MNKKLLLLLFALLLSACVAPSESDQMIEPMGKGVVENETLTKNQQMGISTPLAMTKKSGNENQCIGTFEEFSYQVVDDYHDYPDKGIIYPLSPWEFVVELPDNDLLYRFDLALTYQDTPEIWLSSSDTNQYMAPDGIKYSIFYPDTGNNVMIPSEVENSGVWVDRVYLANDGTIWGRNIWNPSEEYSRDLIPILSKFNRETQRFEFDEHSFHVPLIQNDRTFVDWVDILGVRDAVVWFFIPYDGLYSYSPVSGLSQKHADFPEVKLNKKTFSNSGDIYFMVWPDIKNATRSIYKFSPKTIELITYAQVEANTVGSYGILMDKNDQLWLGPVSRLDSHGEQEILHTNFNKYLEKISLPQREYWESPGIMMESSNGFLWFFKHRYTDHGTAWYDPKTGESCWFTTFDGSIVEDNNHQIWFLGGRKIYKYSLEK